MRALLLLALLAPPGARAMTDLQAPFDTRDLRLSPAELQSLARQEFRPQGNRLVGASGEAMTRAEVLDFLRKHAKSSIRDILERAEAGELTPQEIKEASYLYYARRMFLTKEELSRLRRLMLKYMPEQKPSSGKQGKEGPRDGGAGAPGSGDSADTWTAGGYSGGYGSGSGGAVSTGESGTAEAAGTGAWDSVSLGAGAVEQPPGPGYGDPGPAGTARGRREKSIAPLPAGPGGRLAVSPGELLERLLKDNPGVLVRQARRDPQAADFLAGRLRALRSAGLAMIFLEMGSLPDQRELASLQRTRTSAELRLLVQRHWRLPEEAARPYARLLGQAQSSGIRLAALAEAPPGPEGPGWAQSLERIVSFSVADLAEGERYMVLTSGAGRGEPSLDALLRIPSVELDVGPAAEVRPGRPGGGDFRVTVPGDASK